MSKKLLVVLTILVVGSMFFAACTPEVEETAAPVEPTEAVVEETEAPVAEETEVTVEPIIKKVALVTDVGTIDDESFNQATWQGVEAWCTENGIEYTYYQPTEDSTDARVISITQAITEGANVIVMPGYLFGTTLLEVMDLYPEVYFVAIDVASGDLTYDYVTYYEPAANTTCIAFAEEQAGYLAGYAAVKDGYTKLGFLGGMAVPAVVRYGYGFIQGADDAAAEMGVDIEINYTYGGQFFGDANITAKMDGWYSAGTEIVFAAGGGIYTSAIEAALNYDGMVIGVDVDQNYLGVAGVDAGTYAYNPFVTSAMKGLQNVTETALDELQAGNWANYSGQFLSFSLAEGDYVGLPTAADSWNFSTFTVEEYDAVKAAIMDGTIEIDNSSDASVLPEVSEFTTVNVIE
ncbi:MAG: BMP family ABC transporter substrate-binding protein [Anaerolineaceae bacterium]|nr:BMP family ABC transporter substrate-binding protein [Anaerolineaceae bacterium]